MKKIFLLLMLCYGAASAQEALHQTQQFSITGEVETQSVITIDSLKKYTVSTIGDLNVTDHTGAFKHKDDELKGVLLKDVLSHIKFKTTSPKLLSRFYMVCIGADGYKVVYSWNEIFNTATGDHVYIIVEKNGVKADKLPDSIQMTSATDFKTGRRYLHNLAKIEVRQVQ